MKTANSDRIRVPRTTVMFVTVLSRILRDCLGFKTWRRREHWEFFKTASWELNQQAVAPSDNEERDWNNGINKEDWNHYHFLKNSLDHKFDVYLGVGDAEIYADSGIGKVEIRTKIQKNEWFAVGSEYWQFYIWVKLPNGEIRRAVYEYWDHNEEIVTDEGAVQKPFPPRKISFDKQAETPFEMLTKFQAVKLVKDIARTSYNRNELRDRLTRAGFKGAAAKITLTSNLPRVEVMGPRGEIIRG